TSELTLTGGTHVMASPSFHFLDVTWRRYMALLGIGVRLNMRWPGFYPRGGGCLECQIEPCPHLTGLHLQERGPVTRISGFSAVAGLPESIAERQARRARQRLEHRGVPIDI